MHFSTTLLAIVLLAIFAENIHVFAKPNRRKSKRKSDSELTHDVQSGINKVNMDFVKVLLNDLQSDENFAFSPLNLYSSLALVHLGATDSTKTELSNLLELPVEDDELVRAHQSIGALLDRIQKSTLLNDLYTLNTAKGIFLREGLQLNEEYVKRVNDYYKGGIQQLDFKKGGSEATGVINRWITEKIKNEIKPFEGELPKDTEVVLATALHIVEEWPTFNKIETKTFVTGKNSVEVPTMITKQNMPYSSNENLGFQALSIPYSQRDSDSYKGFSMLIVLPYEGKSMKDLINSLKPGQLWEIIDSQQYTDVNCEIPRFKLSSAHVTKQQLEKLGVKQMFKKAQLGNMLNSPNIKVSQVLHEVDIDVHEKGMKIGSKTKNEKPIGAPPSDNGEVQFNANRPFLFSIYHRDTRTILFTGFVQNPSNENAK